MPLGGFPKEKLLKGSQTELFRWRILVENLGAIPKAMPEAIEKKALSLV